MMRFCKFLFVGLALLFCSFKDDGVDLSQWDKAVLSKANTASMAFYMSPTAKRVIFYMNLCRMDPQLFLKTVLRQYLDSNYKHNDSRYATDLIAMLKKIKPREPLKPGFRLFLKARHWAHKTGRSGEEGHGNFDKRFKLLEINHYVGENCDYGSRDAITILMDLLIDEGIADVGHRKNILDMNFKRVGVSISKHKKYGWDCVMDFRGKAAKE